MDDEHDGRYRVFQKNGALACCSSRLTHHFFLGQPVGMMTARHKGVGFWGLMSMTALIPLIIIFQEPMWTETELQTELQILYYEKIDILKNPSYLLTFTCCILISTLCTN